MTAGDGYKYLLKTVAAGDGDRSMGTPLTKYYAQTGTPPGRWAGAGLRSLADPAAAPGAEVTETQLRRMLGAGEHPATGQPLGRRFRRFKTRTQRVEQRLAALDPALTARQRDDAAAAIEAEEAGRGERHAVAGFDFTFSPQKSVSALWGVADAGVQSLIAGAHHEAVSDVLGFMEREVAATRIGARGPDGAVAQVPVTGLVAAVFDHWDSRAGDPQMHSHVTIANRAAAEHDGGWRTLDSRPMHGATVGLSEFYNAILADKLTACLGVGWEARDRGRDRNPAWEIQTVPEALIREFSTRAGDIDKETDRLIADYAAKHGRRPPRGVIVNLRRQATLATRPPKQVRSLAEMTRGWRGRAERLLGQDAAGWAGRAAAGDGRPVMLRADDVPLDALEDLGRSVMAAVGEKRSTWRRWNLWAEASRQTMGWRFATAGDREQIVSLAVQAAERASLKLTPAGRAAPQAFTRPDGTSMLRPRHGDLFTSQALLDAEARLLELSRQTTGPAIEHRAATRAAARPGPGGVRLGPDQAQAVIAVATSGRVADVLVGPAGAGKTTALGALRAAWESQRGPGTVVGLAPSAAAAQVLAEELGIPTENTARWLAEHDHQGRRFTAGQLVIIDEASLAGTFTLDRITRLAAQAGAKTLLVGDWAQLQAVDAGGAFNLLVADRADAPELADIHRFHHSWEKTASLGLRHGRAEALDAYQTRGRIAGGTLEQALDAAYQAWATDTAKGLSALLVADSAETVRELNQRARSDLILARRVNPEHEITLADGSRASKGDTVITRRNQRRLVAGRTGWVKNGDRWIVTTTSPDGSVTIRREGRRHGATITLPAAYAAQHLDLGYAVTAFRAQGATVDTAHTVVTEATTRENLYVAMTRGRRANTAHVAVDQPSQAHAHPGRPGDPQAAARAVLAQALCRTGAEPSARQAAHAETERWGSMAQLCAEYETLLAAANQTRWAALLGSCGLTEDQTAQTIQSQAFAGLCAELDRAEANGHNMAAIMPRLAAARPLDAAADPAAALRQRVSRLADQPAPSQVRRTPRHCWIVGVVPEPADPIPDDFAKPLNELTTAIQTRAAQALHRAAKASEPWLAGLGPPPADPRARALRRQAALAIAAYRDRHHITGPAPFGQPTSPAQRQHAARVQNVINQGAVRSGSSWIVPTPTHPAPALSL
jgi:conjugative relaxase-like TrwC/TraI family protein